jgi:hypothetical protein
MDLTRIRPGFGIGFGEVQLGILCSLDETTELLFLPSFVNISYSNISNNTFYLPLIAISGTVEL